MSSRGSYAIRDTPTRVFEFPQTRSYLLTNTGSTTIYLEQDQAASALSGQPLRAGATKEWSMGSELWAVCASGETGTLNVGLPGSIFDTRLVGSETATALLASGLADAIAERIEIRGAPPIDTPAVLTATVSSDVGGTFYEYDVSKYRSLVMSWGHSFALADPSDEGEIAYAEATVSVPVPSASNQTTSRFELPVVPAGTSLVRLPIIGDVLRIRFYDFDGNVFDPNDETSKNLNFLNIIGSYQDVPSTAFFIDRAASSDTVPSFTSIEPPQNAVAQSHYYFDRTTSGPSFDAEFTIPTIPGIATVTCGMIGAFTGQPQVIISEYAAFGTYRNIYVEEFTTSGTQFRGPFQIRIPARPIKVAFRHNAAARFQLRLTLPDREI